MRAERGFTLLEMLVVLLIAGLMSTLSIAWLDSGKAPVHQALERLASASRQQAELALHGGEIRGLRWNGSRPEFVRLIDERWQTEPVALATGRQFCKPTGQPAASHAWCSPPPVLPAVLP